MSSIPEMYKEFLWLIIDLIWTEVYDSNPISALPIILEFLCGGKMRRRKTSSELDGDEFNKQLENLQATHALIKDNLADRLKEKPDLKLVLQKTKQEYDALLESTNTPKISSEKKY